MPTVRNIAAVAALIAFTVGAARSALAHEIHSTHTTVRVEASGFTLQVRVFADDLSASVARAHHHAPPADSSFVPAELLAYVSARMPLIGDGGKPLGLTPCGARRERDAYLLCFRAPPSASLTIGNQLLAETHADQVNMVQCEGAKSRRTFLFTGGKPPARVVAARDCVK